MITISQSMCIEVAHSFPGHPIAPNQRVHGHSLEVTVKATRENDNLDGAELELNGGMVMDFHAFGAQVEIIVGMLDHHFLNEVPDLGAPTLENIALYIGRRMATVGPLRTISVKVERKSLGQSAEWIA